MDTPDALERQVHRIHELLVRSHEDVTWNDHIPDPDNSKQLRQIDITIRRDGKLTLIECRLSRRRQNVKWVEELVGRRQSLGERTRSLPSPLRGSPTAPKEGRALWSPSTLFAAAERRGNYKLGPKGCAYTLLLPVFRCRRCPLLRRAKHPQS